MNHSQVEKATDSQLLARFEASRDQEAFAELVRRHAPMVLATTRRLLRNRQDAEDAFQATMFALAKSAGKLRNREVVAGWLHRTAYTCAIGVQRSNTRWQRRAGPLGEQRLAMKESPQDNPPEKLADKEVLSILDEELTRLSQSLRDVVVLCLLEGHPQNKVAEQLGISTSVVSDRLAKARMVLNKRLVRRGIAFTLTATIAQDAAALFASASVPEALVSQVSQRAARFALGASAVELGVSPTIIQLANKVTFTMKTKAALTIFCWAIAIVCGAISWPFAAHQMAQAQTFFLDDFSDGSIRDGNPLSWTDGGFGGTADLSGGDLTLTPVGSPLVLRWAGNFVYDDVIVETQTRVSSNQFREVGIWARGIDDVGVYRAGISGSQWANGPASQLFILRAGLGGIDTVLASVPTDLDPTQSDISLEFGLNGDSLTLSAWAAGDARPLAPQLAVQDDLFPDGPVGPIFLSNQPNPASATFRHFSTSPVPEPTSASLFALGLLFAASRVARTRR